MTLLLLTMLKKFFIKKGVDIMTTDIEKKDNVIYCKFDLKTHNAFSFNEIKEIFTAIKVAIIIAIIFCLIFSLLCGFCKSIVLVVFGMIFSAIYSFILCPIVLSLAILALHIALIVYLAKVNGAYKSYKRNPVM